MVLQHSSQITDRPAWLRNGSDLAGIDSPDAAMEAAGLNWRAALLPVRIDGEPSVRIRNRYAVTRLDKRNEQDGGVLGLVSGRFHVVENSTAFEFFHALIRAAGARYTRAGSLRGGKRVYLLAELPEPVEVVPGDEIIRTLLMINAFDGSMTLRVSLSPVRVVCSNMLTLALQKGQGFSIRHGKDVHRQMQHAGQIIARVNESYGKAAGMMQAMAYVPMTQRRLEHYVQSVLPMPEKENERHNIVRKRERVHELFETGIGSDIPAGRHTLWRGYQAVTEMIDHDTPKRREKEPGWSAMFGSGAILKQKAYTVAEQMLAVSNN